VKNKIWVSKKKNPIKNFIQMSRKKQENSFKIAKLIRKSDNKEIP